MKNTEAVNLLHGIVEEYQEHLYKISPVAAQSIHKFSQEALQLVYLDILRLNQVINAIEEGIPVTKVPSYELNKLEEMKKDG